MTFFNEGKKLFPDLTRNKKRQNYLILKQRSWYSHSSGFAGFVPIPRYKSPRGAAAAKLPPSPAIVGYTMLN